VGVRYIGIFFLASCALGASVSDVFETSFLTSYSQGFCKQNSVRFLQRLEREGVSTSGFSLVKIENKGIGTFGLVNAEKARSWVKGIPVSEEKNWHEHWIVVDQEGTVYDSDFTHEPSPIPFENYLDEMFLNEPECGDQASLELCGGKEDKLNDYQLTFFQGDLVSWKGSLAEALQKF